MLCENKLTNLVFKTKKIVQNTIYFLFVLFLLFFILEKNKQRQPRMKCINVMQCKSQKQRKTKKNQITMVTKNSNEAQGPCQKDSIRLSLLHPKLFRCTTSIGVLIHMGIISNSKIGIKVQSLYQFTNEYHRILCLRHKYFWFVCSLSSLQLVTVWTNVSRLSTKMTNPCRLIM